MKLDFRQLEALCAVMDEGGFTAAAKALQLAQATVSERIANLEEAVGAPLLERHGRKVASTKVGEMLYERARELLKETRNVGLEVEAFLGKWKGTIRIGASTVPGNHILPGILAEFRAAYPEGTVEMTVGDSDRVTTLVSFGTLELGFVSAAPEGTDLEVTPLWSDELVLVAPPSHPWCTEGTISLKEVIAAPLILREPSSGTRQSLVGALGDAVEIGADALNVAAVFGSPDAVKEGVIHGLGMAFLSERAVRREVDAGLLAVIPIEGLGLTRRIRLVADPKASKSPLAQALIDFIEKRMEE